MAIPKKPTLRPDMLARKGAGQPATGAPQRGAAIAPPADDDDRVPVTVRMKPAIRRRVKLMAADQEIAIAELMELAFRLLEAEGIAKARARVGDA